MKHLCILAIFAASAGFSAEQDTTSEERWAKWHKERTAAREAANELPPNQRIEILGSMVRLGQMGEKLNAQQRDVFENARPLLLAIPGHAEYYAKAIEAEREKALVHNGPSQPPNWISYDRFRTQAFGVMGQLPSAETVRVLGSMLYDERDYQPEEYRKANPDDAREFGMNASGAAGALSNLRIVLSPAAKPDDKVVYRDLEFWRTWYEQVKAGKRTFRFAGDPQEYDLQGPVSFTKAPTTTRTAKRPAAVSDQAGKEASAPTTTAITAGIIAAIALGVVAWHFIRKVRR